MGMAFTPFFLVVVFQVYVTDFSIYGIDAKRRASATGDTEARYSRTVTGQRMNLPRKRSDLAIRHPFAACRAARKRRRTVPITTELAPAPTFQFSCGLGSDADPPSASLHGRKQGALASNGCSHFSPSNQ